MLALGLVHHILRKRRYSDSTFQQDTLPAHLGHRLGGSVQTGVPADQPPATPFPDPKRVVWRLEVNTELPGVDYRAVFELPVVAPQADPA
ncbi:MAG: hypothetical protein U5L98_11425 [Halomonas sp.]|uniref:hypothetical protein n=1 Tax=Halomonas sp. TaxID=1486246 RepID=UPI002ACD84EF|nr:hypothetical protein [Halomonas sp.]MDZ7853225.1 hypothetical protein [Halomonas sp.]